jgi:hypothetical protein
MVLAEEEQIMYKVFNLNTAEKKTLSALVAIWIFDFLALIVLLLPMAIVYPNSKIFLMIALSLPIQIAIERFYKTRGSDRIINMLNQEILFMERKKKVKIVGFFLNINSKMYFCVYTVALVFLGFVPFVMNKNNSIYIMTALVPTAFFALSAGHKLRLIFDKNL